jgi:hypothetical protein
MIKLYDYRGGINTVGKEHFTSLYSSARETALTSRNIKSGWIKVGLFPPNPDRVLRDIEKPLLVELTFFQAPTVVDTSHFRGANQT